MRTPIEAIEVSAYRIPTECPESDGTLEWDATTLVLVEIAAGGQRGLGYGYADRATATLIHERLATLLIERDAWHIPATVATLRAAVRNLGYHGIAAMAISTVDVALWDLKAKLLQAPLTRLLGAARNSVPVYGSGGFTSYSVGQLQTQLSAWAEQGIRAVKMKVGRHPKADRDRVSAARHAIGRNVQLFVDANGAYSRKQALALAESFRAEQVSWFEEPVSSNDLSGLRLVRDHAPPGMDISAGEYGYDPVYFRRMLEAGAVDVLQADATRCGGVSGFLAAASLCDGFTIPLSSHCAPALHLSLACAAACAIHLEYFHDHVRIEHRFFDGAASPRDGCLFPDESRPGLGLQFKRQDARAFEL